MKHPLLEHDIVRPGTMWKSDHPLLLPRNKLLFGPEETWVMVVHIERKKFEDQFAMNYVEIYLLTEEGTVQSLILMENSVFHKTWLAQFYSYCIPPADVL